MPSVPGGELMASDAGPTLVVVSGRPGSGKTTMAHELARAIPCPAICRDEIKEGMVHAARRFEPAPGDALTMQTLPLFFAVVRLLLEHGATVVAEAAFQDRIWRPGLEPLRELADLVVVQCHVDPDAARLRIAERGERPAHADPVAVDATPSIDDQAENFRRLSIEARSISVDTSRGYEPGIDQIVAVINDR